MWSGTLRKSDEVSVHRIQLKQNQSNAYKWLVEKEKKNKNNNNNKQIGSRFLLFSLTFGMPLPSMVLRDLLEDLTLKMIFQSWLLLAEYFFALPPQPKLFPFTLHAVKRSIEEFFMLISFLESFMEDGLRQIAPVFYRSRDELVLHAGFVHRGKR